MYRLDKIIGKVFIVLAIQKKITSLKKRLFSIEVLSIKHLTLLGFTLVALPLALALLYSANQVNQLSKQGANAIFDVAELININREISSSLKKMERFASQFVVLKDDELLASYLKQEDIIHTEIIPSLSRVNDANLKKLSRNFIHITESINQLLQDKTHLEKNKLSLVEVQHAFKRLTEINGKIAQHSNELINLQASKMKWSAENIQNTILWSLLIIPISLLIGIFFIILITKPLKLLTAKIKRIERGDFEGNISVHGSIEINEIADALEMMRTRLHALELQKSSFIRHISHELKTPLAAIREGTELLYDNSVGPLNEEQQEISLIIKSSVKRLQRLIEDLLNFNIVLDSTSLQDREKILLSRIIETVLEERKLDIKRKNLVIDSSFDGSTMTQILLHSNAKQLTVIFDNLLSNAIKYSPEEGVISLNIEMSNDRVLLTISDQGPGIALEQQGKIFNAFYQGTAPQDNTIKGSGLGLTIVKELLMRLNGTINIESQMAPPSGTSIQVSLSQAFQVGDDK